MFPLVSHVLYRNSCYISSYRSLRVPELLRNLKGFAESRKPLIVFLSSINRQNT